MFITDLAHVRGQGVVVIMSSTQSGRFQKQYWRREWNTVEIEAKLKEGYRFAQAVAGPDTWYVVLTDTGEDATWEYNDKEFPRDERRALVAKGYTIKWLW